MRKIIFALALGVLFAMPFALHAEAVVIQLMEVVSMGFIPGDNPLDGPDESPDVPTRPNSFHATIDGNNLSIVKQNDSIPFAQAIVVNATNGGIILNQQFTNSLEEQISNAGVYVLHIETAGGALVGQFIVQ